LKVKNVRSVRKEALAQVLMLQATTFSFSFCIAVIVVFANCPRPHQNAKQTFLSLENISKFSLGADPY